MNVSHFELVALGPSRTQGVQCVVLAGEITKSAEKLFRDGRSFGVAITPVGLSFAEAKERVHELVQKGSLDAMIQVAKWIGEEGQ